jgi:hypothetical protein
MSEGTHRLAPAADEGGQDIEAGGAVSAHVGRGCSGGLLVGELLYQRRAFVH